MGKREKKWYVDSVEKKKRINKKNIYIYILNRKRNMEKEGIFKVVKKKKNFRGKNKK